MLRKSPTLAKTARMGHPTDSPARDVVDAHVDVYYDLVPI